MLAFITIITIITVIIIIAFFVSPQLSPIPYYPTNKKDLSLIIKTLLNQQPSTIIDLGAGSGSVIFAAANAAYNHQYSSKFIAVEINPILILMMIIRRIFHPNKKNIRIIWGDIFKFNFQTFKLSNFITFYLYISPWLLKKAIKNLTPQLAEKNFTVVSYMYEIPSWKKKLIKTLKGVNKIFVYSTN